VLWLFKAYEAALQRDNVLDFDDQKFRAYVSLQKNKQLLSALQSQYSEIIVDEFQDINKLDFVLIKDLAEKCRLVVTGDDDQAIYGFRGCSPDYIIDLEQHLGRPVTSYELQINYRCPRNIVEHADKLIRNNTRRIIKNPIAHSSTISEIKVVRSLTSGIEARTIVSFIKRVRRSTPNLAFVNFAVLYRTNAQSLPLQIEFILNDIPYYVRKEDNILHNDTLAKLLGVLKLKLSIAAGHQAQTADQVHTIQAYFRFVNQHQVSLLNRFFQGSRDFVRSLSSTELCDLIPKIRNSQIVSAVQEVLEAPSLIKTFDVLANRFHGLQGMIGSLEEVVEEKVPLGELYDVAANFKGNIGDFVETMERALERARLSNAGQDEKAGVGLLTYFRSKGRQWHTVILTTCNDGIIPHKKAPVEDERRLFYVAMTRTSSNLLISYLKEQRNPQPILG
jgi:DNA helicase II / ATP-dependent DNA helicase PcrA